MKTTKTTRHAPAPLAEETMRDIRILAVLLKRDDPNAGWLLSSLLGDPKIDEIERAARRRYLDACKRISEDPARRTHPENDIVR